MLAAYLKSLYYNRYLLGRLVERDIKVRYKRSVLGFAWSLLNPLLMMLVISAVFSAVFRAEIDNYTAYFLCGNVLFSFFAESTGKAMTSLITGAELTKKIYMPKYLLPLSKVLSSFVNLIVSMLAVLIMLIITGVEFTWRMLLFPAPLVYLFFISLGVGLILCVLATFFRDMEHIYGVFTLALMYLTPIIYPVDMAPAFVRGVIALNPLYHVVQYFRMVVMWNQPPTLEINLVCAGFCAFFMALGLFLFKKNQDKFVLYL